MEDGLILVETAKLAKEKGFNHAGNYPLWYNSDGTEASIWKDFWNIKKEEYKTHQAILRPAQSLLQKWLREVHKINVEIIYNLGTYLFSLLNLNSRIDVYSSFKEYKTYEEALEKGLQEALKLIK